MNIGTLRDIEGEDGCGSSSSLHARTEEEPCHEQSPSPERHRESGRRLRTSLNIRVTPSSASILSTEMSPATWEIGIRSPKWRARSLSGGVVDGRVANAGVSAPTPLSPKINFLGTVALIEALRPLLAESEAPRIAVTSSAATLQGNDEKLVDLLLSGDAEAALARGAELADQGPGAGYANYSSSKRAISRWIRRVAPTDDYAGAGIGINGVGPGQVRLP